MVSMHHELIDFIKRNTRAVGIFTLVYAALSVMSNLLTGPEGTDASSLSISVYAFISLAASVLILVNRMYFYYRIVSSYREVKTRFAVSAAETLRIYAAYFLRATLWFFMASIGVVFVYMMFVDPASFTGEAVGSSFAVLFTILLSLYLAIYAIVAFKLIFVPHICCSTNALPPARAVEISRKMISFDGKRLLRAYAAYHGILIALSAFVMITDSKLALFLASVALYGSDILWSIALSWWFIRINLARETMEPSSAISLPDQSGSAD